MKFDIEDIKKLRAALVACKLGGLESVVFSEGQVRGLGEKKNAVIFDDCVFSFGDAEIGVARLQELEKRLSLFEDVVIEGEVNDANKTRKLVIKSRTSKMDFRCTDSKLIKYPRTNNDEDASHIRIMQHEVAILNKSVKALGAEELTIQINADGRVHLECQDTNNDRFETDLSQSAVFVEDEPVPSVFSYQSDSNGVLLSMLDFAVRTADHVDITIKRSGNMSFRVQGYKMLAIPRIDI